MKVKELKERLEIYNDEDDVLVFIGRNGKERNITEVMPIVNNMQTIGVAIECEK